MKFSKFSSAIFFCIALSSCATKVTSIKDDGNIKLQQKEGFLLIALQSNINLSEIIISGEKFIKLTSEDLQSGSRFILVNLPAGEYAIEKIKLNKFLRIEDFNEDIWSFSVKENTISYVGHLDFESSYLGYVSYVDLKNKSSIALEYLEQNFAEILKEHNVQYQGPGEDSFFKVVGANQAKKGA